MPDNTNVNNNASVVVVGRTAPVPPGQQKSEKSVPVVIASDQSTIPVAEQNKVASEVALSLLGIPIKRLYKSKSFDHYQGPNAWIQ